LEQRSSFDLRRSFQPLRNIANERAEGARIRESIFLKRRAEGSEIHKQKQMMNIRIEIKIILVCSMRLDKVDGSRRICPRKKQEKKPLDPPLSFFWLSPFLS